MKLAAIATFFMMIYSVIVPNKKRFEDNYLNPNKMYEYQVKYIDSTGEILTDEKLILKPTGNPWATQRNHQEEIQWIYFTDTLGVKKIKPFQAPKIKLKPKETTGGFNTPDEFYLHPPRTNQYELLFYSCHPGVIKNMLQDTTTAYSDGLGFFGPKRMLTHKRTITPIQDSVKIGNELTKVWEIQVESTFDDTTYSYLNSNLRSLFSKEFGYLKMYHTYQNGIKINFELQSVINN